MIEVKGRRAELVGAIVPPPDDIIVITIQLSGNNASIGAEFAKVKYLKQAIWCFTWDDGYPQSPNIQQVLSNRFYTNGCGTNIPYRAALALVGHNTYHGREWAVSGSTTYPQQISLVSQGWDLENHSDLHLNLGSLNDTKADLITMQNLIYDRTGYLMNIHVVPTNFPYYTRAADELGFLGSITQGAKDGYPIYPNNENWSNSENLRTFTDYNLLPVTGFIQIHRHFTESWNANDFAWIKPRLNSMLALSNANTNMIWQVGAHGWTQADFTNAMDYTQSVANDRLWVVSRREAEEYRIVKDRTTKSILFNPATKVATITLDQSAVPAHIRWRGLTIDFNHMMAVSGVSVNGANYSWAPNGINRTIINIEKELTVFPPTL